MHKFFLIPVWLLAGTLLSTLISATPASAGDPSEPGAIHGTKWNDGDANGERDPDEPGLGGVTIYADSNQNGVADSGEPQTETLRNDPATALDESGRYTLTNLTAGEYVIREVVPDGFVQTFPPADHRVSLAPGEVIDGLDFGNRNVQAGSLRGRKWYDGNANAQQDSGEPGLPGVIIYIDRNSNGALDDGEPAVVTGRDDPATDFDEGGLYGLAGVEPGRHVIREVVPDGFRQTAPSQSLYEIDLLPDEHLEGLDFGNRRICDANGDRVVNRRDIAQIFTEGPGLGRFVIARRCAAQCDHEGCD